MVKKVFSRRVEFMVKLYNACFSCGYFLREWKVELGTVTLHPFFLNVLEQFMASRLYACLEREIYRAVRSKSPQLGM